MFPARKVRNGRKFHDHKPNKSFEKSTNKLSKSRNTTAHSTKLQAHGQIVKMEE